MAHSGLVSDRLAGRASLADVQIEKRYIHSLAAGRGGRINVVIDGFEKIRSPIYGALTIVVMSTTTAAWHTQDVGMWLGHPAYIEIGDGAIIDYSDADDGTSTTVTAGSPWTRSASRASPSRRQPDRGRRSPPGAIDLSASIAALRAGLARHSLVDWRRQLTKLRSVESRIPDPTLAPAIADGTGEDEHVHIRGSHKNLGAVVPRRFLEVLGGSDSSAHEAEAAASSWPGGWSTRGQSAAGAGAGQPALEAPLRRGDRPDAGRFRRDGAEAQPSGAARLPGRRVHRDAGWSIKAMHRLCVLSSTYRMSEPAAEPAPSGSTRPTRSCTG